jgi:hypothetical protein
MNTPLNRMVLPVLSLIIIRIGPRGTPAEEDQEAAADDGEHFHDDGGSWAVFHEPALSLLGTTPRDMAADDIGVAVDRGGGLYGGGEGGNGVGIGGGSPPATSYRSSSIAGTVAGAGAGTTNVAPHLEHLPFFPAAASGALNRAPHLAHVTEIGITSSRRKGIRTPRPLPRCGHASRQADPRLALSVPIAAGVSSARMTQNHAMGRMWWALLLLGFTAMAGTVGCSAASSSSSTRVEKTINKGGDSSGMMCPTLRTSAQTITHGKRVNLPHTWNLADGADGGDNYYRGPGWYRLRLPIDCEAQGPALLPALWRCVARRRRVRERPEKPARTAAVRRVLL